MDTKAITKTRRVIVGGRWFLIIGLVFYSAMTTTPFVSAHSEWAWSGWVLGLIVDAAFIMALSAESTLAKYGVTKLGKWPVAFRWLTGLSSVFLNVWLSVAARDWVGVAVHLIAPALVMLLAEVGPVYMKALADAERDALKANAFAEQYAKYDLAATEGLYARPVAHMGTPLSAPEADREAVFNTQAFEDLGEPETEPQTPRAARMEVPPLPLTLTKTAELPDPIDVAQDFATEPKTDRMTNAEANKIIEEGWRHKLNAVEVAAACGRHPATIRKKFKQLDAELTV
ncbi:hypothetical protein [Streptomyces sp. NPDC001876]|uniref:hypothetical protein n=1 Tax=Streptomyces sp. NPDC001876 TaxID=3154402 RepID=UPI0033245B18